MSLKWSSLEHDMVCVKVMVSFKWPKVSNTHMKFAVMKKSSTCGAKQVPEFVSSLISWHETTEYISLPTEWQLCASPLQVASKLILVPILSGERQAGVEQLFQGRNIQPAAARFKSMTLLSEATSPSNDMNL